MYNLSESDVKVLKQTINTVNNLPSSQRNKSRPTIKHAFAYVELTEQGEDGLWSAKEVYFDETGAATELEDGRTWGADSVYIIVNGTVSVGQVVRVEAYYMVDSNGAEQAVWVGSAIGGGIYRLKCISDNILSYNNPTQGFSLIDNDDLVIQEDIFVTQRKFTSSQFYENEILYAQLEDDIYDLSPFLAGIGGV